jgi:MFS family permease
MTDLHNGYQVLFSVSIIRNLIYILIPVMFAMGMFMANYNGMMFDIPHVNSIEFGWLEAFFATGIVIGAIMCPRLINKYGPNNLSTGSTCIVGICFLFVYIIELTYQLTGIYLVVVWSLIIGIGESMLQVPAANIILTNMPDEIRGQGVAIHNSIMNIYYLLGALIGGLFVYVFHIIGTIMLSGLLLIGLFIFL